MATPPAPGIYVPIPTFFTPTSSQSPTYTTPLLDAGTQAAHALYLARAGIKGLVALGSTGEAVHLHPRDRHGLISGLRKALEAGGFSDYPLIAGTASNSIEETVEQLVDAKDAGAQWGMVLVPGYFAGGTGQEGIVRWFQAVADQSPVPIMVYHYPGVSNNVKVLPSTYETLSKHPNIVGCKLSHGDLSSCIQIASNPSISALEFACFTGLGQQLLPVIAVGFAGAIDGSAGFFPKTLVRLYQLCTLTQLSREELQERKLVQYRVSCMEEIVVRFGTVGIKEAISRLRGFGMVDGTRLPLLGSMGHEEWARWKGVLDAVEEIEQSL